VARISILGKRWSDLRDTRCQLIVTPVGSIKKSLGENVCSLFGD
jgi:hypothetical protein